MKHSLPVLVASKNEELRLLIREMLGRHGFFHVLEAHSEEEALHFYQTHPKKSLSLVHHSLMSNNLLTHLSQRKNFVVVAQPDDEKTILWSAQLGVRHFLSFPFSSRSLLEKINEILQ